MNDMVLVKSANFNGVELDCYVKPEQSDRGDFWATREQIGQLLEYENPADAIAIIHYRNKDRLDKFSSSFNLKGEAGLRTVTVYNFKGLLEICRYSNQPKANDIMDWLWDVADEIRRMGSYSIREDAPTFNRKELDGIAFLYEYSGLKGNQVALALDKYIKSYTGRSALIAGEVILEAEKQKQPLTPTKIGEILGISNRKVNQLLAEAGYQHKVAGKWEPLEPGTPYALMQDVGKAHSDGVPVCQLKWYSDIIPVIEQLMEDCA